jgi:hypothetical protein
MDLHTGLKRTVFASCLALCGAGCATSAVPAPNDASRSHSGSVTGNTRASDSGDRFEGDWYYGSDCDFGHYVTLGLKRAGQRYSGHWSDGTRVRGSQGELQGEVGKGELLVQRCDDGTEVGGAPDCPKFGEAHDVLVRTGNSLVWSRVYDGKRTPYVTLHRAAQKKVDMHAECKGDADDEGGE